jgi:glycosyltransferase involved in cell wall biosynthesis
VVLVGLGFDEEWLALRIGLIAPPWLPVPPVGYGGTEMVLDTLSRGLAAAGHEVFLFATGDSTCAVHTGWVLPQAAGTVATTPAIELRHVIHAYAALQEWGAEVIHDHTLVGPVYGPRTGIPVVTTNHGPFLSELGDLYRAIGQSVPVIALSHHHASTATGTPVAAVIYHGVDVRAIPFETGAGGYGLFLGRMTRDKGLHVAVRVAREAGVALKIAAKMREPAEQAFFESEVAPFLGGDIEYLGEVGPDEKYALLGDARFLLNPLAWPEPFGLVMIEALACGTPVVATPCGSAPELITKDETGILASTKQGLVEAVARAAMLDRARCREDAVRRFSAERMVTEHVALYERVRAIRRVSRTPVTSPVSRPVRSLLAEPVLDRRRSQVGLQANATDGTVLHDALTSHWPARYQKEAAPSARGGNHGEQKTAR